MRISLINIPSQVTSILYCFLLGFDKINLIVINTNFFAITFNDGVKPWTYLNLDVANQK